MAKNKKPGHEWFKFQLAAEEKAWLSSLAREMGLSLSSWARLHLFAAAKKQEAKQGKPYPRKHT